MPPDTTETDTAALAEWLRSLTARDAETLVYRCLTDQDIEGAVASLRVLAVKDAIRAKEVATAIKTGLNTEQQGVQQ
jgi:folylpolyglutamate synthase/dihydropteroate synthase